jgi:phenylpropionate dioxygenase-like ring-hydroxylating dioxygenase large terminal subunit
MTYLKSLNRRTVANSGSCSLRWAERVLNGNRLVGTSPRLSQIIRDYDHKAPLTSASTPPSSWYCEPTILQLERRAVFSRSWQVVGRADQLCGSGRYVTDEIAGEPVLFVRGADGILRGFFNVCRHHGAVVVTEPEGRAENLRCPYHGWTYNLTGELIHTPDFAGVANFDCGANGLIPIQVAEWQGWVFAKLEPTGPALLEFFGGDLIKRLEPLNIERLNWLERRSYFLNCNWKVFVDNYLDGGYHVPQIHGGLNSVLDYRSYSVETGARYCLQSSRLVGQGSDAPTAAVRQGKQADYYWIYPNFMVNIYDGVMDTNLVVPRGVDRTDVIFDYYFVDVSKQARERNLASIAVSEQIQTEDRAICESVQRGLGSRSYDTGRLSVRREAGEHLFHRLLYADLNASFAAKK